MTDALIIDAVRTPRGIGKVGKGALSNMHPQQFIRDLELDRDKVNVDGGSIALGHPIGATGVMLIGTALDEPERRELRYGLVTMCAAGGMAPAIIIERLA